MDPTSQGKTRALWPDKTMLDEYRFEDRLLRRHQVEVAGVHRSLRVEFYRTAADENGRPVTLCIQGRADLRQHIEGSFKLGAPS